MADWNAAAYSRFETERTRPARDLAAQLPVSGVGTVVDLGCGPGNSTALLVERYPAASVLGLDSSPDMLAKARQRLPAVRFEQADIARWRPDQPVDVVFSNATLQWLPDHATLFPRLLGAVASGGVLAVQMPDNLDEPSHVAMREVAADPRWRDHLGEAEAARTAIPPAARYVDLLSPLAASVDVWRTTYHHRLENHAAIVAWFRTSGLRPYVDPLPEAEKQHFLARYEALVARAYPPLADGSVLLAFPRLFIVARRSGL